MEDRDLVVDYGNGCGSVQVQNHTLAEARQLIMDEFDDDMIPNGDWVFFVNGVRKTRKQESKLTASQFVGKHVVIGPKHMALKRSLENLSCDSGNVSTKPPSSSKRLKVAPVAESNVGASSRAITPSDVATAVVDNSSSSSLNGETFDGETNTKKSSADDSDSRDIDPVKLTDRLDQQVDSSNDNTAKDCKGKTIHAVDGGSDDDVNLTDDSFALIDSDDEEDDDAVNINTVQETASGNDNLEMTQVEPSPDENQHKEADEALSTCRTVIESIETILKQDHFCSEGRRTEWLKETTELLQKARPKTVIGVLGNTGV